MALLSTEVEVGLYSRNIKRYEDLGYEIPRRINKYGKLTVKQDEKLLVRVEDLSLGSNVKVDVDCDNCKKVYQLSYYSYNESLHDGKNYCVDCASKILNSGENHYLWDFQKTTEERILKRQSIDGYPDFIKNVLKRDEYTCQCCGVVGTRLNVHHLNSYDWFVDGRTDCENAITLCERCHKNFHLLYGRGKNTKEQFEEWIGCIVDTLKDCNGDLETARKVYCVDNGVVYDSVSDFCRMNNIRNSAYVYMVCDNKPIYVKSDNSWVIPRSVHGLHTLWYDKYINMTESELEEYVARNKGIARKRVVCLNDGKVFSSVSEASRYYKVYRMKIAECCKGQREYYQNADGTKLMWKYCDDFDSLKGE